MPFVASPGQQHGLTTFEPTCGLTRSKRQGDTFILQYRDYPHLPKFVRHRSGIAMMSPPTDEAKPAAQVPQA
jgi:hypothetical protein